VASESNNPDKNGALLVDIARENIERIKGNK
jgi:hypothetical protein